MKFLLILLLPFLVSVNSISNEKNDRVKCCDSTPEKKEEYFVGNYKYVKSYWVDMLHNRKHKIEYILVADENDELKYITEFRYENTNSLDIILQDSRRIALNCEKKNIDKKTIELKTTIPKKGIYYLSFIRKDTSNQESICAGTLFLKRQKQNSKREQELFIDMRKTYEK